METTVSMFPWHMWEGGWWAWWFFPVFMLLMILGCAAMLVLPHRSADATRSALRILNERLAKGEIRDDEYAAKKAAILSPQR